NVGKSCLRLKMKNKILFIGTVRMWGINLHEIESLNKGKNPDYFKNISLSKRIFATEHLNKVIKDNDYIFLAVPSKALKEATQKIVSQINNSPIFINLAKVKKKPTIVDVVSQDLTIATKVSNLFLNSLYFKAIPLNDEIGVEICGALKNLLAIGTGIAQENHSSINTISAILTQGIKEIKEIILLKGGQELTILNLSGIGDMFLTCTSKQSRNFSFGKNLYRKNFKIIKQTQLTTIEGYTVYPIVASIIKDNNLIAPILESICEVLSQSLSPKDFVKTVIFKIDTSI
uniref:glycerol-3-phosphate dehydrogenase (NAD(+)) n=1 Tax=Gouania willdenowi TaxID=441366 RepID=A0A8C5GR53_GOUWI